MHISFEQESKLCKLLLLAQGMNEADAELLGEVTAHSDFAGVYSHGLSRFANYLKRFANGAMKVNAEIKIETDNGAVISYDCDNGSGIIAMCRVYDELLNRARKHGIAIGTGRRASNIGCGNYYGQRAAKDNVIGLFVANTITCVAPYGGVEGLLGTNPIIMAAPGGEEYPIIMDISTSITAFGKIQAAAREGKPIPAGWALDANGKPTTDAKAAQTVLPIASHKGYGLGVMVDVLSALLAKANYGYDIGKPAKGEQENTGFAIILIDIEKFMPLDEFKAASDKYVRTMKNSRKAEGVNEIYMPGEIEFKTFDRYMQTGFEVSEALGAELAGLAFEIGMAPAGITFESLINSILI